MSRQSMTRESTSAGDALQGQALLGMEAGCSTSVSATSTFSKRRVVGLAPSLTWTRRWIAACRSSFRRTKRHQEMSGLLTQEWPLLSQSGRAAGSRKAKVGAMRRRSGSRKDKEKKKWQQLAQQTGAASSLDGDTKKKLIDVLHNAFCK